MLTAPARGASATLATLVLLCLGLSGCGEDTASPAADTASSQESPAADVVACRERWKDLEKTATTRAEGRTPSTLPDRWNSVAAGLDYYATSAKADDCGATLSARRKDVAALAAFGARVAPYDLELRLARLKAGATAYAARAEAPKVKPAKKGAKAPVAPAPRTIGKALRTLTTQAPRAGRQQGPAWQQANAVDLGVRASVAKAVKDVKFLSSQSGAYRAGDAAARQIAAAVKLAG